MSSIVVVADSSCSRIFSRDASKNSLDEIETIVHPEARLHQQDLVSDSPGRNTSESGGHAYQNKTDPKQQETIDFAKRTARYLDEVRNRNKLDRLSILAAPAFLGELRKQLSEEIRERIVFELDKNLTRHSISDIQNHLP